MLTDLTERLGTPLILCLFGAIIGFCFGFFAQRSKFCMRTAAIEFSKFTLGKQLAVWLMAFSSCLLLVQSALAFGFLEHDHIRAITAPSSLVGAVCGGLIFGVGMILARGCPSRMLVLAGQGNLRAIVTGMIFAIVVAATNKGLLSPLRDSISALGMIGPEWRDMGLYIGLPMRLLIGFTLLLAGLWIGRRNRLTAWGYIGALGVGAMVACAWIGTSLLASSSFDPVPVGGITFSAPSSEMLLRLVSMPQKPLDFDLGLVPSVFLGSLMGALIGRDWQLEGFKDGHSMRRYFAGATLMGFGAVLSLGCAVGAGVTGGAVFSLTAWLALAAMWISAMIAHRLIDA